jgi:hypothetical protein
MDVTNLSLWNRVISEKQMAAQLIQKFLEFYGNQKFIAYFTRAHHWSLS